MQTEGIIYKALSGFYYVRCGNEMYSCRARGQFRHENISPLVGDLAVIETDGSCSGVVMEIRPRKNSFLRPSVANVDAIVMLCSESNPVTDPFLIDRITVLASMKECEPIICINKSDLSDKTRLSEIYSTTGYTVVETSAVTGQGLEELKRAIHGKICVFTGNSGVGKSSILNRLSPELGIATGEVSDKLGRGRHTTRHVELFDLGDGTFAADTPGFSSLDIDAAELASVEGLDRHFPEFSRFIGRCRYDDCAHIKEPGCAIRAALKEKLVSQSRYDSYVRLKEAADKVNKWEITGK